MTYTGYTLEALQENPDKISGSNELINNTDILVDGRFDLTKRNILLKFRGSENQRIIDLKNSKIKKEIVLANI
jgi:anaerobic ribonucleoside-triphosphate reductase activating protein